MKLSLLAAALTLASARADYLTTFSIPPYILDQTILGVDGWDHRLLTEKGKPDAARVVAVRWNGYKPALMTKGANLKHPFPATTGDKVKITFDLAVTFPDRGALRPFRFGFNGAPCGEFFMDMGAAGGLGCQADGSGRGGIVVLKKSEVIINSFYTFTVAIDYAKQTYDLSITGEKRDGTPFQHEAKGVAFESKAKAVSSLYILATDAVTAYLGSIAIKSN